MKVKTKDDYNPDGEYCPLRPGKEYTVFCLSTNFDYGKSEVYLYEPSNESARPLLYFLNKLIITDPSIPPDWRAVIFADPEKYNGQVLVCGPSFLTDVEMFVNLHDMNLSQSEEAKVISYLATLESPSS